MVNFVAVPSWTVEEALIRHADSGCPADCDYEVALVGSLEDGVLPPVHISAVVPDVVAAIAARSEEARRAHSSK